LLATSPRTICTDMEPKATRGSRPAVWNGPARMSWARLIAKIYEIAPLACPRCAGPMRAIALIEEPMVVRRILEHLGQWSPRGGRDLSSPGPPPEVSPWSRGT